MRRVVLALAFVGLSCASGLLGAPPRAHATTAGYDLWAEQKVPDWSGSAACITGGAAHCSESYAEVAQYPGTPGQAPSWIDLFCQVWNRDSQGVLHTDEAEVITTVNNQGNPASGTANGFGLILQQGPTSNTGSSGLFVVQGSDAGKVPLSASSFAGTPYSNSGVAFGIFRGGPATIGVPGVLGGLMTTGIAVITITGTIFHAHYVGTTTVPDGTTQGTISCSVSPSLYSDVYAFNGL